MLSILFLGVLGLLATLFVLCLKRKTRMIGFSLLVALISVCTIWPDKALFYGYMPFAIAAFGISGSEDHDHAKKLVDEIIAEQPPPRFSASVPGRYPVFATAGSKGLLTAPMILQIYYVTDFAHQDRIIQLVTRFRSANRSKPVRLEFYEAENWLQEGNYGERGKEKIIRRTKV